MFNIAASPKRDVIFFGAPPERSRRICFFLEKQKRKIKTDVACYQNLSFFSERIKGANPFKI
jgi:hypothetical protein